MGYLFPADVNVGSDPLRKCRVDALEVAIHSGDAHQIDGHFKEELEMFVLQFAHGTVSRLSPLTVGSLYQKPRTDPDVAAPRCFPASG
jgi:hypothetical protein